MGPLISRMPPPDLWYEKENGDRFIPLPGSIEPPPEGYEYQRSRFAFTVTENILKLGVGRVATGTSSWLRELPLAMARPTLIERLRQICRGGFRRRLAIVDAILTASVACEGCMNVLLWEYGCTDGYPRGSVEHRRAGTRCELCKEDP